MTQAIFDNIEGFISSQINQAERCISIAVAWFTNNALYEMLTKACEKKVGVNVLLLNDILNRNEFGLDFGVLSKLGAEVRFAKFNKGTMHNKFCIIDDMVITGSYNWTYHANNNSENILMTDEDCVVNSYREEFDKLFGEAIPIPQPYERLKWTDVKEGDFSELRRNIFRDVIAKNDENRELKRIKLINLDHAYKSGDTKELAIASALMTEQHLKTIMDVLTSRSQDFTYRLWEENIVGKPYDNVEGYINPGKWFYVPFEIKEDKYHQLYVDGSLNVYYSIDDIGANGLKLRIFDQEFIKVIRLYWKGKDQGDYEDIPTNVLIIERAKLFFYKFPSPMFNKSQPRTWKNAMPRTISAINLLGIVKEMDADRVVFYDGWNPQKRGEKIAGEFFTASLIEHKDRNITDVLTSAQKGYVGNLFYEMYWDIDEDPADVRFCTIDKWIFIPTEFGESRNHEKYVRGCIHFYKWYKRRMLTYMKIRIDIYDASFISCIERYLQGSMNISKIPEDLLCINLAKLSIIRLPNSLKVREKNTLAVFCLVKEVNENNIIYYEGWDPQRRGQDIINRLRQG